MTIRICNITRRLGHIHSSGKHYYTHVKQLLYNYIQKSPAFLLLDWNC